MFAAQSSAVGEVWDNGNGNQDWNDPLNWDTDALPVANADINNVSDAVDHPIISANSTFTPVDVHVGLGAAAEGRLDHTAGAAGSGASNWTFIGRNGGTGTYNLADTSSTGAGVSGFAQGSGSWTTNSFRIGLDSADSVGTVNVNTTGGITATNDEFWVGANGTGTLNLENGDLSAGSWFVVGREAGGSGTLNMTGGTITASTASTEAFFVVGSFTDSTGVANVSGGTITSTGGAGFYIGEGGDGTLNLSGNATIVGQSAGTGTGNLRVGLLAGSTGAVNITGSNVGIDVLNLSLGLNAALADTTGEGTLNFFADAGGISTINAFGDVNLSSPDGDFLNVDLSSYTGAYNDILLIDGATSAGEFTGLFQDTIVATDGNANNYYIDYTVAGDVLLRTEANRVSVNQWAIDGGGTFNDTASWTDGIIPGGATEALFGTILTTANAPATVTLDSGVSIDQVRFNNANDYVLAGPSTLTLTNGANVVAQTGRHWLRAVIDGVDGVNFSGSGEVVFDAVNTYSGGVTVDDTNLAVTNAAAIPSGNSIAVSNNGQVRFWGSDNGFFGDGSEAGNNTGTGTGLDPNTTATIDGAISIDDTSIVDVNSGANVAFTGVISGAGQVAVNSGATVALSAANTYSGVTTVNSGTLTVSNAASLGAGGGAATAQTLLAGNANDGTLALTGGITIADELIQMNAREGAAVDAIHITSDGNNTLNGNIRGDLGGTNYNFESTSGTLTLGGTISAPDLVDTVRNFTFNGPGNFNITGKLLDAVVDANGDFTSANTTDNVFVTKRGAGTLTVSTGTDLNDDYWYGDTVVEEGTLEVVTSGGDNGELRSTVTVNQGATFDISSFGTYNLIPIQAGGEPGIGGSGTVDGGGTSTLGIFESTSVTPGDGVGTLKVNGGVNLTYFDANEATVRNVGSLNFELGDTPSINTVDNTENDLISVSGNLAINAPSGSQFVVNVTPVDGVLNQSTNYTLFTAGSRSGTGTAANFTVNLVDANGAPLVTRQSGSVVLSGNNVQLDITGAPLNLTWTADVDNQWDVATTGNWNNGSETFFNSDSVTFNATGGGGTVNVSAPVAPNAVTVSNASYSFEGSAINAGSVTVGAGGVASFENTVGGAVQVNNGGTLAGTGTLEDNVSAASGSSIRIGGAGLPTPASFTLLDNFDTYGTGATTAATGGVWTAQETAGGTGIASTIVSTNRGNSLQTTGGFGWSGAERDIDGTGADVAVGETKTLFWQVQPFDSSGANTGANALGFYDFMMGLSPDVSNIDTTNAWQDFQVMPFVNNAATTPFINDNSGNFVGVTPGEWHNVWVVVNNDATAPTYDLYVSSEGGDGVLIGSGSFTNGGNTGGFNQDLDALAFMAAASADASFYIDNIYYTTGANTANPVLSGEILTVGGDVDLASGSDVTFDLAGSGIADKLAISGALDIEDGVLLNLVFQSGVNPMDFEAGDSWDLFDFTTSGSSTFDTSDQSGFTYDVGSGAVAGLPGLDTDLAWDLSSFLTDGTISVISTVIANLGDFNGDLVVDALDYAVWRENVGDLDESAINGNGNGGGIDASDFTVWLNNFGADYSSPAPAQTPEPAAAVLLLAAAAGAVARRRRASC